MVAQELVDKIVHDLDIASISSLRLACRALGDRCSGQRYKSFFEQQAVDLTSESLQRLCLISAHPNFGPAVRMVAVTAVVYDTSELEQVLSTKRRCIHEKQGIFSTTTAPQADEDELDEAQRNLDRLISQRGEQQVMRRDESDVQLLADILRKLGGLDVLALEAAVDRGNTNRPLPSSAAYEWHPVWVRASQVYYIVMSAIARSGVAIHTLTVYDNSLCCSVPTFNVNELMPLLQSTNFVSAAQHIRVIALSVSTKVETDSRKIAGPTIAGLIWNDDPTAVDEDNYPGIARLLKQMPNLENLHLHLFDTLWGGAASYVKVFSYIAEEVVLSSLRQLTLRCLYCDASSLLKFLRGHENLEKLELRQIHLTSGSWSPIFQCLVNMPSLQHVAFHNLWTPGAGVLSLGPKDPSKSEWKDDDNSSFPCMRGTMVHSRMFSRKDIQSERFDFADGPKGRALGSPQFDRWRRERRTESGPP